MKIRFITPYFPPEVGAAQTRIYELAEQLQALGHCVSVLTTFPNYPTGIVPREWRGKFRWQGLEGRIPTDRIWAYPAPNRGFLRRVASQLVFALFASIAALVLPRCDIAIIESPPLFDGFIGLAMRAVQRTPYVFMVSDLWPESAVQMGALKSQLLIKASRAIELLFYRRAAAVLALTAGIQRSIASKIEPAKVLLFRNSVDCSFFRPGVDARAIRAEIGLEGSSFLALYAGTFGLAQKLNTILDAAALIGAQGQSRKIHFVLAGAGAESDSIRSRMQELGLRNVTILDPLPKARMPELINAADCVIIPLRDLQIFRGALPTKMFEAMACAKPVVLAIRGEAEAVIREADAGYCIPPESPSALLDAVTDLARNSERASQLGANGRRYVTRHFSRDVRALELSTTLQDLLKLPSRGASYKTVAIARPPAIPADVNKSEGD